MTSNPLSLSCSYPEEAEVDHDAEITADVVEEEVEANHEEDDKFTFAVHDNNKKEDIIE